MSTASATEAGFDISRFPRLAKLPNHLKQFIVDQDWNRYTPIDHAVWRYIMRQAVRILKANAHRVYFEGLLNTGISLDAIPRIEDMNDILGVIGWGCVAVDGFIPPAAFMEYQAHRVLVIACEMRQIHHIEYTPAPDIVHEAAGHAPIIVDKEYADYLQRFGEIGARAMSSRRPSRWQMSPPPSPAMDCGCGPGSSPAASSRPALLAPIRCACRSIPRMQQGEWAWAVSG